MEPAVAAELAARPRGLGNSEYGAWIFWRFLEEKIGGDPAILREIWERADVSDPGVSPDDYSLQAVHHELTERGLRFADVFAGFASTNRLRDYIDAEDAGYPTPPLAKTFTIGRQSRDTGWRRWRIDHLSSRFVAFRPRSRSRPARGSAWSPGCPRTAPRRR